MHHAVKRPSQVGPYVALEPISTSETSWVVKGRHFQTGRIAAIKLVGNDPDDRGRLRHEARVLSVFASAPHRGVIELFEAGVDGGIPWVASRFVDGPDLSSLRLAERAKSADHFAEVTQIGLCIADALAHAHAQGVVHGDLSPRNILLDRGTDPVLIDFGAAVVTFDGSAMREVVQPRQLFRGTPGYASPEQIRGMPADSRSDLYSLGCILYELLCGLPPFVADNVEALCQQHLHLAPKPPSSKLASIPSELDELVLALLEKRPNARLGHAQELVETLARYCAVEQDHPSSSRIRPLSLHRPQLVGRAEVLEFLTACVNDTADGRGGFVLVTGTSGIGKTRVLNELAHRARGFRVIYGRCGAVSRSRSGDTLSAGRALEPFSPFLEWLAYQKPDAARSTDYATWLQVLAPYELTLETSLPASSLPQLPPDLGRSRVLGALLNVLVASAAEQPLLLIVDDIQWADDLSRSFLQQQYRSALESSNVLIVAAHRSEEPEPASLNGEVRRVQLNPLGWDELAAMAADMLGLQLVPAGLAEALHRNSEGNPFFAAEYVRAFIECGLLRRKTRREWELLDQPDVITPSVPSSLRDLFALRLTPLSAAAKDVLEMSALLGRQFSSELIEAIVRETASDMSVRDALAELVHQHILDPCDIGQYRFVHDKLREAQAQATPDARRRALHRSVAAMLDMQGAAERFNVSPAQHGLHWAEACEPTRAIEYLKKGAEQAAKQYMNADAAELYALALSQIDAAKAKAQTPAARDYWNVQAISLGEARGDLLGWAARHEEASAQHDAALRLAQGHDRLLQARLERKKARAYWTLHDYDGAMAALSSAQALLGPAEGLTKAHEIHEWIEVQQGFFWLHYYARRAGSPTQQLMQKMASVVELNGTPIQKSMFYVCASSDLMARERYSYSEPAVDFARRALKEISDQPDEVFQLAYGRFVLAFALLQGVPTQCREAADLFESNLLALTPIGEATLLSRSLVYQAVAWRRSGDADRTHAVAALAKRSSERVRLMPYIGAALACEAWVMWKTGNAGDAKRLAEEASTWWGKVPHSFPFYWLANFILLDFHYLNDDFTDSLRVVSELLDLRQQRLHPDVDMSLRDCESCLRSNPEPRRGSLAIRRVLDLAHQHSYL